MPRGHKGHITNELRPRRLLIRATGLVGSPIKVRHDFRAGEELFLRWIVLSLTIGLATGAFVAVFDFLLRDKVVPILYNLDNAFEYLLLPVVGLVLAALIVKYFVPSRESSLTEDYVLVFHDPKRHMRLANLPGKMVASFLTLAFGGSMGLEGPSIYAGASLGDWFQQRFKKLFRREDLKLLLVAGGAAGMAAIFKAPLTGVVFAMEAPYKDSLAARALVPALVASSASYLTFVLLAGSEPIFAQSAQFGFKVMDLAMALLLGIACGIGARIFVWLTKVVTRFLDHFKPVTRAAIAGIVVGGIGMLIFTIFGEPFIYGPGYKLIEHLLHYRDPFLLILLLLGCKMAATSFTCAGGGVGGLFFPMAVMGTAMGSGFSHFVPAAHNSLYPIIGLAAFVGAGYRTPLAAVAFVAETTGSPWALIPAMIASVVAFLTMGDTGISDEQRNLAGQPFTASAPH